jgi:hypothetical protein
VTTSNSFDEFASILLTTSLFFSSSLQVLNLAPDQQVSFFRALQTSLLHRGLLGDPAPVEDAPNP